MRTNSLDYLQERARTPSVSLRHIRAPWSTQTSKTFREFREMIDIADRFVGGDIHFSYLACQATLCFGISREHHLHPEMQRLIQDWYKWSTQVWPEMSADKVKAISIDEYRRRIARDLGK